MIDLCTTVTLCGYLIEYLLPAELGMRNVTISKLTVLFFLLRRSYFSMDWETLGE